MSVTPAPYAFARHGRDLRAAAPRLAGFAEDDIAWLLRSTRASLARGRRSLTAEEPVALGASVAAALRMARAAEVDLRGLPRKEHEAWLDDLRAAAFLVDDAKRILTGARRVAIPADAACPRQLGLP